MKNKYNKPEDFIIEESFLNYCFQSDGDDVLFWEEWIKAHPEKEKEFSQARKMVFTLSAKATPQEQEEDWNLMELKKEIPEQKSFSLSEEKSKKRTFAVIGGMVVLALLLVGGWWFLNGDRLKNSDAGLTSNQKVVPSKEYATLSGQQKKINLEDGTEVWLNAKSKLMVLNDFKKGETREVLLEGEAFFDVAHVSQKPFYVHTDKMDIAVLGTAFNVKAYLQDKSYTTTLISGSVNINLKKDPSRKIKLQPEEKLTIFNEKMKVTKKNTLKPINKTDSLLSKKSLPQFLVSTVYKDPNLNNKVLETVWRQGKLAFRNESFEELALQLSRRYGVTFHFENEGLKKYRYTGIFTKESLGEVLNALQMTSSLYPFKFQIQDKEVFISK